MQEVTRISLEGLVNTRDLGGYQSKDGRCIKPHKLIRSGELFHMTASDIEILTGEYGLRKILDFRTSVEAAGHPDPEMDNVVYIHLPILEEAALGITRENDDDMEKSLDIVTAVLSYMENSTAGAAEYMDQMYTGLITGEFSKGQYRRFFEYLLEHEEGSLLWHCTAGKDRAGTAAVLLLNALDVEEDQILADYMKVNEFTKDAVEEKMRKVLQMTGNQEVTEQIKALFSVKEEYIESIYAVIGKVYGSMDHYLLKEMNLTREKRDRLKNMYLF